MKKAMMMAGGAALLLAAVLLIERPVAGQQETAGAASDTAGTGAQVKIDNFSFTPNTLTVKPGTRITWTNGDDLPHTVVAEGGAFKSAVLDTNEQFSFTADKPGTYSYYCSLHPKMTATLVVK